MVNVQYPSGEPLLPEPNRRAQGIQERIQLVEFGPNAQLQGSSQSPLSVRSGGMAVYYPRPARARFRGLPAVEPGDEPGPIVYISNWPDDNVLVFDPRTKQVTKTIAVGQGPGGIVISPDGRRLYVALKTGGAIAVIDREQNATIDTISVAGSEPFGIGITPDGTRLLVNDYRNGGQTHIVDIASKEVLASLSTGPRPEQVAVNPEGSLAYVTSWAGNATTVIDLTNYSSISRFTTTRAVGVALDPLGRWFYVSSSRDNGTVAAYEIPTNRKVGQWQIGNSAEYLAASSDGQFVFVTNSESDFMTVIDVEKNRTEEITVGEGLGPLVLLPLPPTNGALSAQPSRLALGEASRRERYSSLLSQLRSDDATHVKDALASLLEINQPQVTVRAMLELANDGNLRQQDLALETLSDTLDSAAAGRVSLPLDRLQNAVSTVIANRAHALHEKNLEAFLGTARTGEDVASARARFLEIWQEALVARCSDARLGEAGQRCISEREPLGQSDWFAKFLAEIH